MPFIARQIGEEPKFVNLAIERAGAESRYVGEQQQQARHAVLWLGFDPLRERSNRLIVARFLEKPLHLTIGEICDWQFSHLPPVSSDAKKQAEHTTNDRRYVK